jgi:hypothetical protein
MHMLGINLRAAFKKEIANLIADLQLLPPESVFFHSIVKISNLGPVIL